MPHLGENSFFWQMPKGLSEEEREYYKVNATEMCDIFGALFTDGVTAEHMLENDKQTDNDVIGSSLAVIPGDGLNIVVSIGSAMVNKHLYIATLPIQIPVTVGTNDVLLRCDTTTEKPFVTAIVRKRTSTELTDNVNRTANVHEVPIATVTIPTGSQTVSEIMIVDQRLNTNLASDGKPFCGLMKPRPNADTKGIWEDWTRLQAEIINKWKTFEEKAKQEWEEQKQGFNQSFETLIKDFDNQILNNQKTFEEWFETLQTYLDGDVAANLAGEITRLKMEKADKNTVYTKQETDTKLSEKADKSSLQKQGIVRAHYWLTGKSHGLTLLDTPPTSGAYVIQFTPDHSSKVGDILQIRSSNETTDWKLQTVKVGEEDGLQDNTFIAGFPVTLNRIDNNCFFKSGGGTNDTLPPQIRSFAVTSGNAQNKLSWLLPVDTSAYEGLVIIKKVGSAPTKVSDGTKINLSKTATSYTDTGLTNDTKYYYRAFPYNSKKQYQTELTGAVAYGTPKAIDPIFGNNSWEVIDSVSRSGNIPSTWQVGDTKDITLTTGETITMQIYGFKHDDLASGGKAGITLGMKNLMKDTRRMNSTSTNIGGFTASLLYAWLQGSLFDSLPNDLKLYIKTVNKKTSIGNASSTIETTPLRIFLFSEIEIFGDSVYSVEGEGTRYNYFILDGTRSKKSLSNGMQGEYSWWERSPVKRNNSFYCAINSAGGPTDSSSSNSEGICFGFCI